MYTVIFPTYNKSTGVEFECTNWHKYENSLHMKVPLLNRNENIVAKVEDCSKWAIYRIAALFSSPFKKKYCFIIYKFSFIGVLRRFVSTLFQLYYGISLLIHDPGVNKLAQA